MADLLPDPPTPPGVLWPRDWHSYDQYRVAHDSNMAALAAEGLVLTDAVTFIETRAQGRLVEVNVRGRVTTHHGATVTVNKWLAVDSPFGRLCVMTREYDYHVRVQSEGIDQDVFRYDNCHGGVETLHRHAFDVQGREVLPQQPIELARMPTLNLIVREGDFYAAWLIGAGESA